MSTPQLPLKIASSRWPLGSEWRRWDLHVHTPESRLGSSFRGVTWEQYVTAIETSAIKARISVIGVTDYMTLDGYEKLFAEKNANARLETIDLLIPNIEFRMMPQTSDGKALNIHLLIDPSDANHIDKIKGALRNLKFSYSGQYYGCCRDELIAFGRAQDPQLTDDEAAYRSGINQFKPDMTVIKKWLDNEQWLKKNSLVGIANGKDGISGLPLDGFGATRQEILKWSDFVFSGNPRDREHYLGLKPGVSKEKIIHQYRSLKPCVHGSDAHDVESLFKPDNDRFCWVKSDPTFHGLRQILWEPEDRVHVGKLPPQPSDRSQQIRRILLSNSSGWFATNSIELNPGLVAVIGEKGAGKTAVVDLTSFASGCPMDRKSLSSFITKGSPHLSGTKIELEWGAGGRTTGVLMDAPLSSTWPRVRYLSQDFVERLCSSDHEGAEIQKAIEDVVFARLDEVQKEGYSSFGDLRGAREDASNTQKEALRGELATLHKEVDRLQEAINQRGLKVKTKAEVEQRVEELKQQLPAATQSADQKILEKLEKQQVLLKGIEEQISVRSRRHRTIEGSIVSYVTTKKSTAQEVASIKRQLLDAGVVETTVQKLSPTWAPDVDDLLQKEVEKIDAEIASLKGSESAPKEHQSVFSCQASIAELKESVAKDDVIRKRLLDLQKQVAERTSMAERLAKEIQNLDEKVTRKLEEQKAKQVDLYLKVFNTLSTDETGLKDLYSPMQDAIDQFGDKMQFSVSVGYQIDAKSWLDRSSRFYDGRRVGAEAKRDYIEKIVETKLVPAWKSGNPAKIKPAFEEFLTAVDQNTFLNKFGTPNLSRVELLDWMFSVEHIELTYKIRYSGVELEYLSPGARGIALLVLYLLMDEDDTRPLLIDQPEGNLDNSSVYNQLVPYIRKAKKRRQIILVTHNPNLVVATDAEQIIIATAERPTSQTYPRLRYDSGALEHSVGGAACGVREAVCLLLEGGEEAFKFREKRYSFA